MYYNRYDSHSKNTVYTMCWEQYNDQNLCYIVLFVCFQHWTLDYSPGDPVIHHVAEAGLRVLAILIPYLRHNYAECRDYCCEPNLLDNLRTEERKQKRTYAKKSKH